MSRGGILRSIGESLEMLSQIVLVGIILVGRLGVAKGGRPGGSRFMSRLAEAKRHSSLGPAHLVPCEWEGSMLKFTQMHDK